MKNKLECFKAYDIRGKLDIQLDKDIAYRIGRAYAEYIKPKNVVLGADIRLSSEELKLALSDGLRDSGVDVIDIGMTGTEEVYFATSFLNAGGGIEVTASHNPKDYNGMKLVRESSKPISGDTGLREIQKLAEEGNFCDAKKGEYKKISILDDYVNKILSYISINNLKRTMKVVFNSGNGAAGHVLDKVETIFKEKNIPIEFIKINNLPDGNFPNGIPNPLLPECRHETIEAVKEYNADLGIAFDGDFDRCFFFDETGDFIEGYYIVGLLAKSFLDKAPRSKIIYDPRNTWNTIDIVESSGGTPVLSKTGHAFIKEKMRAEDAIYGGEMSAHHYFKDFNYCDSGMIPWLLIIEMLSVSNLSMSQLVNSRKELFPSSGEINFILDDANLIISEVEDKYKKDSLKTEYIDGLSMEFDKWRFNLRSSNTEPVVRVNIETKGDVKLLKEKTEELKNLIKKNRG